jgi:hypothetical protein
MALVFSSTSLDGVDMSSWARARMKHPEETPNFGQAIVTARHHLCGRNMKFSVAMHTHSHGYMDYDEEDGGERLRNLSPLVANGGVPVLACIRSTCSSESSK